MTLAITQYRIFLPVAAENASRFSPACFIIASTFSAISNVYFLPLCVFVCKVIRVCERNICLTNKNNCDNIPEVWKNEATLF